jgi:hypothetical protein
MHAISITTIADSPMTIPQYAHDISHLLAPATRVLVVRLPVLVSAVESTQMPARHSTFFW